MLYKVSLLRAAGARRPVDDVKAGPWLVGTLTLLPAPGLQAWKRNRAAPPAPTAVLLPSGAAEGSAPAATLLDARVVRINERGFLLSGIDPKADGKSSGLRQSWWCIPELAPSSDPGDDGGGEPEPALRRRTLKYVSIINDATFDAKTIDSCVESVSAEHSSDARA